jgi:hypothetical protein
LCSLCHKIPEKRDLDTISLEARKWQRTTEFIILYSDSEAHGTA